MAGPGRGRGASSWREVAMGGPKSSATAPAPLAPRAKSNGSSLGKYFSGAEMDSVDMDHRLLFVSQVLIGHTVIVKVRGGDVYEGIFSAIDVPSEGELGVMLKMAKLVESSDGSDMKQLAQKPQRALQICADDLLQVIAKDVKMTAQDVGPEMEDMGFGTDSAISNQRGGAGRVGRELEKWVPDGPDMTSLDDMSMDGGGYKQGGWDQFAANESMYGVQTSFDEEMYTTKIDNTKISEREAARLAREIERGQMHTSNVHLMEERNLAVDDSGIDEEDKYSSVIRDAPPAPKEPKRPAWSTAGAGVAVLAGPKSTEPPKPPPAKPSAPPPKPQAETETAEPKPAEAPSTEQPKSDKKSDTKTEDKPKAVESTSTAAEKADGKEGAKKPAVKSTLSASAKPFKMNANAAAFVPGGAASRTDTATSTSSAGSHSSSSGGGHKSRGGGHGGNWNHGPQGGMGGQGWVGGMPGPGGGYNMGMVPAGMMQGMGGPGQPRPGMMPPGAGYGAAPFYPQMAHGQYYPAQPQFMSHSQYMGPMPPGGGRGQPGGYIPYGGAMGGMGMGPDGQPAGGGGNK